MTTTSVSTSAGLTRRGMRPSSPRWTSSGLSASWMTTRPWKRRASSGATSSSSSARPAFRVNPPATSSVWRLLGIPSRSSSPTAAASAVWRGSRIAPGSGSAGGSTTMVARPSRGTSSASGGPASGNRSASTTASATSAIGLTGGGGRTTTALSGALTTTTREPTSNGRRGTLASLFQPTRRTGLERKRQFVTRNGLRPQLRLRFSATLAGQRSPASSIGGKRCATGGYCSGQFSPSARRPHSRS